MTTPPPELLDQLTAAVADRLAADPDALDQLAATVAQRLADAPADREAWNTPEQVAERVQLSRRAVYRAIQAGELPAYKLRGRLRVAERDLDEWARSTPARAPGTSRPLRRSTRRPRQAHGRMRDLLADLQRDGSA